MPAADSEQSAQNPYLSTDTDHDAVEALESTARFLDSVLTDADMWKWTIIALHNAVQGFMVLALQGTWHVTVLRREQRERKLRAQQEFYRARETGDIQAAKQANQVMLFGDADLAPFEELYSRIKSADLGMIQFVGSQHFIPRPTDDQCMECLDDLRNEFLHFVPSSRRFLLTRFPAVTEIGLHVISFLVHESNNITWYRGHDRRGLNRRVDLALKHATISLERISRAYVGLPRPIAPFCGSLVEEP
jgi:hypothetical protein